MKKKKKLTLEWKHILQMKRHASRGCIEESSTTGNIGEDTTSVALRERARIIAMTVEFMTRGSVNVLRSESVQ